MLTERADIELLMKAAAFAKIPPDQLKPEHPWSFSGKTAELLQMAVESIDPVKAAEWRSAAGGSACRGENEGITEVQLSFQTTPSLRQGNHMSAIAIGMSRVLDTP